MSLSPNTFRPSLWHRIGRFILAYLVSLVVSVITVSTGLLWTFGERLTMAAESINFTFIAIGIFAILPAILVYSLVLWLRLPPLPYIVISAGLVGLAGAVTLETTFFTEFFRPSNDFAFIAALTVCGLIAGFAFWFIAFRPPRAPDETTGS